MEVYISLINIVQERYRSSGVLHRLWTLIFARPWVLEWDIYQGLLHFMRLLPYIYKVRPCAHEYSKYQVFKTVLQLPTC